jgi:hypothetical protein
MLSRQMDAVCMTVSMRGMGLFGGQDEAASVNEGWKLIVENKTKSEAIILIRDAGFPHMATPPYDGQ